jgi:ureidoacrylate peracid hydrolase
MPAFDVPDELRQRLIARRGRLHAYDSYEPSKTALVVVDMQNFFMKEGEPMASAAAREMVPNVNRLARALRDAGGRVIWIQMEASEESRTEWSNFHELFRPEGRAYRLSSLSRQGEGHQLWHELEIDPSDETVVKRRYSAMIQGGSDLESVLRRAAIQTVLVVGVATNVCCESTARDSMMRGFRTIMVSDANASFTEAEHGAALLNFITYFGDVQSTDEVLDILAESVEPAPARR